MTDSPQWCRECGAEIKGGDAAFLEMSVFCETCELRLARGRRRFAGTRRLRFLFRVRRWTAWVKKGGGR